MREGIGSIVLYNIIIIFLFVTFAILAGTMSYSKAFKANNRIISAIEKYEGYNEQTASWLDNFLLSMGYTADPNSNGKCPKRNGIDPLEDLNPNYRFCVYPKEEKTKEHQGRYVRYGIVTYIYIDIPVVGNFFRIPVYGESNRVFCFGGPCAYWGVVEWRNL